MHRYLALIWSPHNPKGARTAQSVEAGLIHESSNWRVAHRDPSALILHTGIRIGSDQAYRLADENGVILGSMFRRHDADHRRRQIVAFDRIETRRIVETGGQHLIANYWGKYVAFIRDRSEESYHILRDPMAELTCFHTTLNGIDVFFSHIEDCIRLLPADFSINWRYLTAYLVAGQILNRECGLREIEDIPGGECLTLARGTTIRTTLWNPVDFCKSTRFEDEKEAAQELRSTVQTAVSAWASCYTDVIHNLSGGLDSSIVAGCLAQAPSAPNVTCLNFFVGFSAEDEQAIIPDLSKENLAKLRRVTGHADERKFARLVAERWRFPLIERPRISDYDMAQVWNAPLAVLPSGFIGTIDADKVETEIAQERNAHASFSGLFGDTIFYATFQSLAAIDYAYRHRLNTRFVTEIANACRLSKESVWRVLDKAIRYGFLGQKMPPPRDRFRRPNLLMDHAAETVDPAYAEHPWTHALAELPPGKQNQLKGLAAGLPYNFAFHRQRYAASVNPLGAQPVVELCLQIPVYILLANGVSRGLARRAFADLLPPEVENRTVKGAGGAFYQRAVRANMTFIRESLLDGLLVREGLLDRQKLEYYLVEGQVFRTVTSEQIRIYLATEAWLRQWAAIIQQKAAA